MDATIWKELKRDFGNLTETELRARVLRVSHFETTQTKTITSDETRVGEWLKERHVNAGTLFQDVSQKKRTPYAERYSAKRQEQKWRRFLEIQQEIQRVLPDVEQEKIRILIRRISRFEYGEIKNLSNDEFLLRETLLRLQIRPATLHKWCYRDQIPDDFRARLEKGELSLKKAERIVVSRERQKLATLEICLLEDARRLVKEVLG